MIDLTPIRSRINWLEVTIKDLVNGLDIGSDVLNDATRQHLASN